MDEKALEMRAGEVGLEKVWRDFREDLIAAAKQVEEQRRALAKRPASDVAPWPPMRAATADD